MTDQTDVVAYDVEDRIAWVRFNRPEKRNCMSPTLNRRMMEVLDALEYRDDVGVLVLTGEGSAWSAGMDLKEYFRETEAQGLGAVRQAQREAYGWWRRLRWYQKPTIAMVNGWCFGGGYGPLFACDLAIAADEAQFGLSEINWGILPGGGATKVVVDLLSMRDAMYYAMTGDTFDGKKAKEIGFVNMHFPKAKLREETIKFAKKLQEKSPAALLYTKEAIRAVRFMNEPQAADYLNAKSDALKFNDKENSRQQGMKQFLDDKSYRPGLGHVKRQKVAAK